MKHLGFSPESQADLHAIAAYIADDNPERALSFVAEIEAKALQIVERPDSFPARYDIAPGLRAASHGRYLIFFRELAAEVRVVRILHGARDLGSVFKS